MQKALDYKNAEQYDKAVNILKQMTKEYPSSAPAFGVLGGILFSFLKKPRAALPYCKRAVELAPKSEMASLSLFHSLWALDHDDEAIAEMKRYLKVGYCQDYVDITQVLYDEWVLGKDPPPSKNRNQHKKAKTKS